jgi:hypothetical protein
MESLSHVDLEQPPPHFAVPASFDLRAYSTLRPWEMAFGKPFGVIIRLAPRLVPAVPELFGPRARLEQRADVVYAHLTVSHRAALISTVLPYGVAAEVVAPEDLRHEIADIYSELAARYQKPASRSRRRARS